METNNTTVKTNRAPYQWIAFLFCIHLSGFLFDMLAKLPPFSPLNPWLQLLVTAATVYILFRLRQHRFYRPAAVLLLISLILTLLQRLLSINVITGMVYKLLQTDALQTIGLISQVLSLAGAICRLAAMYLEYSAHSQLIKPVSQRMANTWIWVAIAILVMSIAVNFIGRTLGNMITQGTLEYALYQKFLPLLLLPSALKQIAYILCLFHTHRLLRQQTP